MIFVSEGDKNLSTAVLSRKMDIFPHFLKKTRVEIKTYPNPKKKDIMKEVLKKRLIEAISFHLSIDKEYIGSLVEIPKNRLHGDLSIPCFQLAKGISPVKMSDKLAKELSIPEGFSKINSTGPFLNAHFDREQYILGLLNGVFSSEHLKAKTPKTETILIEYSSPNIAKPFHVGHLRATLLGNALVRLYRAGGFKVITVNHLGDWGTQFGFVWAGCQLFGKPNNASVDALVSLYKKATSLKQAQEEDSLDPKEVDLPEVAPIAKEYFLSLERGSAETKEFWKWCLNISIDYFKKIYKRLDIEFDHYIGESFYSDKLDKVEDVLNKAGILIESEGAKGVELGQELGFARIFTADGRSLYLTRDIAAAIYRKERFSFTRSLYVVGAPQKLHFEQLKATLKKARIAWHDEIHHISFGHVQGMSTRGQGEVVELNDLLDKSEIAAINAWKKQVTKKPKDPKDIDENAIAKSVARAALIFGTLSKQRTKDVSFSWKHALEFQGDTGPYLLYAHARICSIKDKFKATDENLRQANYKLLAEDSAFYLASTIDDFNAAIKKSIIENDPVIIANYALSLSGEISSSYNELKVIGVKRELGLARLALFEAARKTLSKALQILGIEAIERM